MDKRTVPNEILLGEVAAVLQEGREAVIIPTGNSMLPFIRGGVDRVALRKMPSLAVGDILLAKIGDNYILHRLIARNGDALTLMGDGNLRGTEHCTPADVIGTVAAVIRPDGRERTPSRGRLWRLLRPLRSLRPLRRVILAFCRRLS